MRHIERFGVAGAELGQNLQDLRNNITGFVDNHRVANANIFAGDFVGVVERGMLNGAAGHDDRFENGDRVGRAGPTDTQNDVLDGGRGFFGGILVGDSSPGRLADGAQFDVQAAVIELDHQSISVKR